MGYKQQLDKWRKRRATILVLRAKDVSWTEIARRYGITPQRAQQIGKNNAKG